MKMIIFLVMWTLSEDDLYLPRTVFIPQMKSFYRAQIAEQWQNKSAGVKLWFFMPSPCVCWTFITVVDGQW